MTAVNTVRSQLQAAGTTLAASSLLDTNPNPNVVQPPELVLFGSVSGADVARLPTDYGEVANFTPDASHPLPMDVGVIDVASGVRQLDPWGKFYVYCRWESPISDLSAPAITVISAGPDGVLNTKCNTTTPSGDDRMTFSSVGETVNRANVWQVASSTQVKFGIDTDAVRVNQDGSMSAASLTLSGPLVAASGTFTGAVTAASASLSSAGITGAATMGSASVSGTLSVTGGATLGALSAGATSLNSLTLGTALALTQGGTGATNAGAARANLGASTLGDALFTAADQATGRAALGASATGSALFTVVDAASGRTVLGATATGSTLFTAADAATARSALALGSMATQNADAVAITGGTIAGVAISGDINGNVTGSAATAAAGGITGCCVPITAGGTGAGTSAAALQNLGVTISGTPAGSFNLMLLPASGVVLGSATNTLR
jgi:hypothetical protein